MSRSFGALFGLALAVAMIGAPSTALGVAYELESVSASLSSTQAGAHADFTTTFTLAEEGGEPAGLTRDIEVRLPPGMIGNPQGIRTCSTAEFGSAVAESECPIASQVGVAEVTLGGLNAGTFREAIYNMEPPGGEVVARLGFFAGPFPMIINVKVDPRDYSLVAKLEGAPAAASVISSSTTLWGVPAAAIHDPDRITPLEALNQSGPPGGRPAGVPAAPFMTNPTSCGPAGQITITATSYQFPDAPSTRSAPFPAIHGCEIVKFDPAFSLTATNPEAAAPTGIDAELRIPQDETPHGRGTAALKSAIVTLPSGFTINPAAGDGLASCGAAEVGFETARPSACPDAAKIGSAEIEVPALERVLQGSVYQRTPEPGELFRFWLVADELGVHLKLPAKIEANPLTGQLRTVFAGIPALGGNPQVPVESLKLHIFGGPRAPVATPAACGSYQTHYEFFPWSGNPPAVGNTATQIVTGCNKGGFSPGFEAGTRNSFAGHFSPFSLDLTRQDGEANPATLAVTLPQGLLAKLGGVPLCPEAATASGNCPGTSQIGSVAASAGVGGAPLWIPQPGKAPTAVYLAGPYRGGPYSVIVRVPAQAGPFDLGTVVTRAAIHVDPETTQASIVSDPLPQILEGVPIAYRRLHVDIDRPKFTINPTDCSAKTIEARVTATTGAVASPSAGFQATNCAKLAYTPRLTMRLRGNMKRTQNPALRVTLTQPGGQANTARAVAVLPSSQFIDQSHINNPCTRVQFRASQCPSASILGRVRAFTPLLDQPLEGPVIFRSNGGARELPDMVADLHGAIDVTLVGFIDSVHRKGSDRSRVRTIFASVPDAPVTKFTMNLFGGKKGLLENSVNLCKAKHRVTVKLKGQNGKLANSNPLLQTRCK
jgi:hypothetical protein